MKTKRWIPVVLVVLSLALLTACSGNKDSDGQKEVRYASATVTAGFSAGSQAGRFTPIFSGTATDVTSMTVDVVNGAEVIAEGVALAYSGGAWSTTINELPIGPQLTFTGHAYNSSAAEIFTGTTSQAMTEQDNAVVIAMAPVASGGTVAFPRITQISRPAEIVSDSTVTISVSVEGTAGESLTYAITPASSGGSFAPASGSVALNGTTATIMLGYTAPASAGTFNHAVTVMNNQGNSVTTSFSTTVVDQLASASVTVQFNPVITSIAASRSGSDVTFTAAVSDDGPSTELRYLWQIDNGLSFADATANPAVLQGYGETVTGTMTLTVTDANGNGGSTALSIPIAAGQFPDVIVVDTPADPPVNPPASGPTVLASGLNSPQGLAANTGNIYWAEHGTKTIKKMSLATGITTTVIGGMGTTIVFAVDANYVYFHSNSCRMDKVSVNGGSSSPVVASVGTVGQIVVSGSYAYWTATGVILKVNITTGQETTLASGLNNPTRLAVDDTSVYWVEQNIAGAVKKVGINGGAVTTLASGLNNPFDIAVDATSVYWTEYNAAGAVKKTPINGGSVTTLAGALSSPSYLAVGSSNVYWTDTGTTTINAVSKNGGSTNVLSAEASFIYGIATTATDVIWEVSTGTIKTLPQ